MQPAKKILVAGRLLYLLGFTLPAVKFSDLDSRPIPGFFAAELALVEPWDHVNLPWNDSTSIPFFAWLSLIFSGWINPVFFLAFAVGTTRASFRNFENSGDRADSVLLDLLPKSGDIPS